MNTIRLIKSVIDYKLLVISCHPVDKYKSLIFQHEEWKTFVTKKCAQITIQETVFVFKIRRAYISRIESQLFYYIKLER